MIITNTLLSLFLINTMDSHIFQQKITVYLLLKSIYSKKLSRIKCPCNVYPLIPHFYKVKVGIQEYTYWYTGVYLFFLFLITTAVIGSVEFKKSSFGFSNLFNTL